MNEEQDIYDAVSEFRKDAEIRVMEKIKSIKNIVQGNKVRFDSFRQGLFYYNVSVDGFDFQFTVPIEDIGTATLLASDKAITYMRWIRKAIDSNTFIKLP